ncbi:MAG TPA: hypothetical protein PKZ76_01945 [Xanthomonadaceae bacterium]|nr:hypothetical protein [Xanthomonadaceae bacterium]
MNAPTMKLHLLASVLLLVSTSVTAKDLTDDPGWREAGGLVVYLGVMPAAIIRGHVPRHPDPAVPTTIRHSYHVMVAVFDAISGERVEDATIEAQVAPHRGSAPTQPLEPMKIADTVTFGNYFGLPVEGLYRIHIVIRRPGVRGAVAVDFTYQHRLR